MPRTSADPPAPAPIGPLGVALLERASDGLVVFVAAGERRMEALARWLGAAAPDIEVIVLPPWDCLPYDRASPSRAAMGQRMAALAALAREAEGPRVVVTATDAILQRLPPLDAAQCHALAVGAAFDAEAFGGWLAGAGYVADDRVDEPGEYAARGEVIDLWPAGEAAPVRVTLGDAAVEGLAVYDPASQRSTEAVERVRVCSASELPGRAESTEAGAEHWLPAAYEALTTAFEHAPGAAVLLDREVEERARAFFAQLDEAHRARAAAKADRAPLGPERLYMTRDEWRAVADGAEVLSVEATPAPSFATARRPSAAFRAWVAEQRGAGRRVVLAAAADSDARAMAKAAGLKPDPVAGLADALAADAGVVVTLKAELEAGFVDPGSALAVASARDLLGSRAAAGDHAPVQQPFGAMDAPAIGDVVVHWDYGVGVLTGLERLPDGGEAIRLEYHGGAALMLPVGQADRLWRYGSEPDAVTLDRLHTDAWAKKRQAIAAAVAETAADLIALARGREEQSATVIEPPSAAYERVAARFPFPETADQRRSIAAVLADLRAGRPMDRLVVGDVGFGKTEVAVRAAAAAALAGRQVALIAPTTVLARQHYESFRRRFEGTGAEVVMLSRLSTAAEAKAAREAIAAGSARIVVGTHALLSDKVTFQGLALLIVDEEQRFGAAHKTRLKELGEGVHMLTMSATPIPRTLQRALVGLQDLSLLATPPARRRPIRTFVAPEDEATIRTALVREKRRGGQSFVVVPRVEDVEPTLAELARLVPQLKVKVAHGRMAAREADEALVGFADGDGDVLVATAIIETGLDVPRANTMVVKRADLFGLSQLHQLRGRVGRGRVRGVCYLMTDAGVEVADTVGRRLGTLAAFDRLGAGFDIAARDLDLRGGGDLTGDTQAGHINLIGVALYQELLAAALAEARGEAAPPPLPELKADVGGSLPDAYVPQAENRLELYVRLARAKDADEVEALGEEIEDRFGLLPDEARLMLDLQRARLLARDAGVVAVAAGPGAVALDMGDAGAAAEAAGDGLEAKGERVILKRRTEEAAKRVEAIVEAVELVGRG